MGPGIGNNECVDHKGIEVHWLSSSADGMWLRGLDEPLMLLSRLATRGSITRHG